MQENKLVPDFSVQMNFFDDMANTKLKNVLLYVFPVFFCFIQLLTIMEMKNDFVSSFLY